MILKSTQLFFKKSPKLHSSKPFDQGISLFCELQQPTVPHLLSTDGSLLLVNSLAARQVYRTWKLG